MDGENDESDDNLPFGMVEAINERSNELIEEFHKHLDEFHSKLEAKRPELFERGESATARTVFESWAIQKIAGLQLLVLQLIERVEQLENRTRK